MESLNQVILYLLQPREGSPPHVQPRDRRRQLPRLRPRVLHGRLQEERPQAHGVHQGLYLDHRNKIMNLV